MRGAHHHFADDDGQQLIEGVQESLRMTRSLGLSGRNTLKNDTVIRNQSIYISLIAANTGNDPRPMTHQW